MHPSLAFGTALIFVAENDVAGGLVRAERWIQAVVSVQRGVVFDELAAAARSSLPCSTYLVLRTEGTRMLHEHTRVDIYILVEKPLRTYRHELVVVVRPRSHGVLWWSYLAGIAAHEETFNEESTTTV